MTVRGMLFGAVAIAAAVIGLPQVGSAAILTNANLGTINVGQTVSGTGVLWGTKAFDQQLPFPASDTSDTFTATAGAGVSGYQVTFGLATYDSNIGLPGIDAVIEAIIAALNPTNTSNYQVNGNSVTLGVSSLAALGNLTVSATIPAATTLGAGAGAIYYELTVKGLSEVPLPAAGIFLASALGGLGVMRRRAKRVATA